jgi:hypothetical protein
MEKLTYQQQNWQRLLHDEFIVLNRGDEDYDVYAKSTRYNITLTVDIDTTNKEYWIRLSNPYDDKLYIVPFDYGLAKLKIRGCVSDMVKKHGSLIERHTRYRS